MPEDLQLIDDDLTHLKGGLAHQLAAFRELFHDEIVRREHLVFRIRQIEQDVRFVAPFLKQHMVEIRLRLLRRTRPANRLVAKGIVVGPHLDVAEVPPGR